MPRDGRCLDETMSWQTAVGAASAAPVSFLASVETDHRALAWLKFARLLANG